MLVIDLYRLTLIRVRDCDTGGVKALCYGWGLSDTDLRKNVVIGVYNGLAELDRVYPVFPREGFVFAVDDFRFSGLFVMVDPRPGGYKVAHEFFWGFAGAARAVPLLFLPRHSSSYPLITGGRPVFGSYSVSSRTPPLITEPPPR